MKLLIAIALIAVPSIGFAAEKASINCADGRKFQTATLGNENNYQVGYCDGFSTGLNICFNGDEKVGVEILKSMNDEGVLGDEYEMRRFRARKSALKYDIYDGPNGEVLTGIAIPRCNPNKVEETDSVAIPTDVSEDGKYQCVDVIQEAVVMARKASIHGAWDVQTRAVSEVRAGEVVFEVKLISPSPDFSADLEEEYQVKVKKNNCDVIKTTKIKPDTGF